MAIKISPQTTCGNIIGSGEEYYGKIEIKQTPKMDFNKLLPSDGAERQDAIEAIKNSCAGKFGLFLAI